MDTQTVWIPRSVINPGACGYNALLNVEIEIPIFCPECNADFDIKFHGSKDRSVIFYGCKCAGSNHSHKFLYDISLESKRYKELQMSNNKDVQDVWIPKEYIPVSDRTHNWPNVKIQIPRVHPKNNIPIIVGSQGNKDYSSTGVSLSNYSVYLSFAELYQMRIKDYKESIFREYKDRVEWHMDGLLHNEIAPAIDYFHKIHKEYYINGKLHRLDGPAKIIDSLRYYYINGVEYGATQWNIEVAKIRAQEKLESMKKDSLDNKTAIIDDKEYKLTLVVKE